MSTRREQILFRVKIVAGVVAAAYLVLLGRAVGLQVIKGDVFRALADEQQSQTLRTLPQRGEIVDRDGEALAVSLRVDSAYANPDEIKDPERTAAAIAAVTKQDRRKLAKVLRKDAKFVWVARQLDAPVAAKLKSAKLPGIGFAPETKRYYPNNALMGHVLGFVGLDANGLEGVEKRYDSYIKGESEVVHLQRDALNRGILTDQIEASLPTAGHRVELTVDKAIAYEAQKSLDAAVQKYRAVNGVAVALDVDTGAILAMVVSPAFDPNRYKNYPTGYGRNRVVADVYEPGSTMKSVLYAAALQEKVLNANTPIYCENGVYHVADRTVRDTHPHGTLTASEVVKFSSNIGALKIGRMLGRETWFRYIEAFGLTTRTDVDLPGEASGLLRPLDRWNEVLFANTTYGQGIGTTPLQVVNALATIANGGKLMRPYIVARIVDAKGAAVYEAESEVRRQVVEPWVAGRVREALESVVEEEGGTGTLAMVPGYRVAGKTGTSQKIDPETGTYSRTRYLSTFVGFLPARDPRVAILVSVNEPQGEIYGGIVAAPVFAAIAAKSMERLHVPPDFAVAPAAQEQDETAAPAYADEATSESRFAGLTIRDALRLARAQGITLRPRGTGIAAKERCTGTVCDVVFKPL